MKFEEAVNYVEVTTEDDVRTYIGIWGERTRDEDREIKELDGNSARAINDTGHNKDGICLSFNTGIENISLDLNLKLLARWVNSIINRERL